jgi:hypothetical protein
VKSALSHQNLNETLLRLHNLKTYLNLQFGCRLCIPDVSGSRFWDISPNSSGFTTRIRYLFTLGVLFAILGVKIGPGVYAQFLSNNKAEYRKGKQFPFLDMP